MRTQIRILGTIDMLLGAYYLWTFLTVYDSIADFIQREFTLTVFLIGLMIGGVGLWGDRKSGWIANQMTGIHLILSGLLGLLVTNNTGITNDNASTNLVFVVLILIIGARLYWTNKQVWLDEFRLTNKLRLMTISSGTIISLVLLLKSYV